MLQRWTDSNGDDRILLPLPEDVAVRRAEAAGVGPMPIELLRTLYDIRAREDDFIERLQQVVDSGRSIPSREVVLTVYDLLCEAADDADDDLLLDVDVLVWERHRGVDAVDSLLAIGVLADAGVVRADTTADDAPGLVRVDMTPALREAA